MRAMVLAAGLGTRLGALAAELPKPLFPVADVPLIRYNLALLAGHGFQAVAINLHHHGDAIVAELDGKTGGLAITWSPESEILGTGGGLRRMADWLTDGGRAPFLVINGKLVIDVDLAALCAQHQGSGALATLVVREVADAERWGAVDLDPRGRVLRIVGEGRPGEAARRTMFTGVHIVSPAILDRLPVGESCVIRNGYQPALRDGGFVDSLIYDGYFQEHSTPARYLDGNRAVLAGEARLAHPPAALTGRDDSARVAASATLVAPYRIGAGATVGDGAVVGPFTVVGSGATVAASAHLTETVVWRGAAASGMLERAIVTPRGVHRVGKEPERE